jgi:hypothetical protein
MYLNMLQEITLVIFLHRDQLIGRLGRITNVQNKLRCKMFYSTGPGYQVT